MHDEVLTAAVERLGADLRTRRLAAGLTQEELAERAGISVYTVSNLERGIPHKPRADTLRRWIDALSIPTHDQVLLLAVAQRIWRSSPPATKGSRQISCPLPIPFTSLIGREVDIENVCRLFHRSDVRLISLLGPPGVGKTRLSLEVAHKLRDDFPDGVHFIDLASVSRPAELLVSIARGLGLRETGETSLVSLLEAYLHQRVCVLVLDNLEQLVEAAPDLPPLLASSPGMKILATSRVALHVRGEHRYIVSPLAIPESEINLYHSLEDVASLPAIELFVTRAIQMQRDFALTWDNVGSVAQICRRLDGLPLALELAAAQLRLVTPQALLARLENYRLATLASGPRDLPVRQQSLQATLQWSYQLLAPEAQCMLRCLSVFVGGASLDGLQALVSISPPDRTPPFFSRDVTVLVSALPEIMLLLDHRLVSCRTGSDGEPRVHLLETIREFGQQQCALAGDGPILQSRHAAYFLSLAETAELGLLGADQISWVERLEEEHENLRAALRWFYNESDTVACLRLASALYRFWSLHGHYQEGSSWLLRVLEAVTPVADEGGPSGYIASPKSDLRLLSHEHHNTSGPRVALRSTSGVLSSGEAGEMEEGHASMVRLVTKALAGAAVLAVLRRDYSYATLCHQDILTLAGMAGDRARVATSLIGLGEIARLQGDFAGAIDLYQQSLAIRRELDDSIGIASVLNNLGLTYSQQGDYEGARAAFEESLMSYRSVKRPDLVAKTLANLGDVLVTQGNLERARTLLQESLALRQALHDAPGTGQTLAILGDVAYGNGERQEALRFYGGSYHHYEMVQDTPQLPYLLIAAANVHAALHHDELAICLYAATSTISSTDSSLPRLHQRLRQDSLARLQTSTAANVFAALWAASAGWSIERAAQEAFIAGDTDQIRHHTQSVELSPLLPLHRMIQG